MKKGISKKVKIPLWTIPVWLFLWQLLAMLLDSDILLVSPVKVLVCLGGLAVTGSFWASVGFSLLRIAVGFICAAVFGLLLAALSYRFARISEFLSLPVAIIKSTPVASFIILVLVWIPSRNLSVFISFLMAFPVMYGNILRGLSETDEKLLEVDKVFRLPLARKIRYIFLPQLIPYLEAAFSLSLGLCWKAGIAAEVIGIPKGSIGERLYQAKIYLETPELFAWTVTIIVMSILCEKLVMKLFHLAVFRSYSQPSECAK